MSSLTDCEGILSEKTGSSSDTNVLSLTAANSTAIAGTHTVEVTSLATTSSGYLAAILPLPIACPGPSRFRWALAAAQTIVIAPHQFARGQHDLYGKRRGYPRRPGRGHQFVRGRHQCQRSDGFFGIAAEPGFGHFGRAWKLTVSANSISDTTTPSGTLAYSSPVSGLDAHLTVDGDPLTSASNTVANLIPGVTFQLLAPSSSGEQVQVVIGNDNTDVESTVNQFVTDYNSLISAMNTQEGNDVRAIPSRCSALPRSRCCSSS